MVLTGLYLSYIGQGMTLHSFPTFVESLEVIRREKEGSYRDPGGVG